MTHEAECPYCGNKISDLWEVLTGDGDEREVDCDGCGKKYIVSMSVLVTYSSRKRKADCDHKNASEKYCHDCESLIGEKP